MYLTLMLLATIVLPVPAMIVSMKNKKTPYRAVVEGAIAGVAGASVLLILASVTGNGVFELLQASIREMVGILARDANMASLLGSDTTVDQREDILSGVYGQAADLLPSTICIMAAIAAYVEYLLLSRIVKWEGVRPIPMGRFRDFDLPRNIIMGWLILFIGSWLVTKTGLMPNDLLYINISTLFNFVFTLQGISVIFMFCYRRGAPKAIAVIIVAALWIFGLGQMLLELLGFADAVFRFKGRLAGRQ